MTKAVKPKTKSSKVKVLRTGPRAARSSIEIKLRGKRPPTRPGPARAKKPARAVEVEFNFLPEQDAGWKPFFWVMPVVLFLLCASALLREVPQNTHPVAYSSAKLETMFESAAAKPIGERIAFWSESLLQDPYLLAPLGTGPDVSDNAPVFPRAYNCTTFVEMVGALARSTDGKDLADQVIGIRYRDGKATYENRNHFPEADWIPNNIAANHLRDITLEVSRDSGFTAGFAHKDIDKLAWLKEQGTVNRVIASQADKVIPVEVPYVPLSRMLEAVKNVPQGAVLNLVRMNRDRYPVLISHQGFLVWKEGKPFFRQASRNRQIREEPLDAYIDSMRDMPWKVLGFNINAFVLSSN